MDQFMKMRKKMSMAESTRQVLNKSIDLLHKLSNKKISKENAKKEIGTLLSQYFTSSSDSSSQIDDEGKVKLEIFLDQAYEIIDRTDAGDTPLYEAIMMMNKVVVNNQVDDSLSEEKPKPKIPTEPVQPPKVRLVEINEEEEEEFVSNEFDLSGEQSERIVKETTSHLEPESPTTERRTPLEKVRFPVRERDVEQKEVGELIQNVIRQKAALEHSIEDLNASLQTLGFELRPLG